MDEFDDLDGLLDMEADLQLEPLGEDHCLNCAVAPG